MSYEPLWDDEIAETMVGATILVGVIHLRADGSERDRVQMHGVIDQVTKSGVTIRLEGERAGETYSLPPDLNAFEPAAPGAYRLHSTGEVIEDPDYTTSWSITNPD
ncbi:MAG: hypothetical protein ACREH4_09790 [Vitreimonas sp.]